MTIRSAFSGTNTNWWHIYIEPSQLNYCCHCLALDFHNAIAPNTVPIGKLNSMRIAITLDNVRPEPFPCFTLRQACIFKTISINKISRIIPRLSMEIADC